LVLFAIPYLILEPFPKIIKASATIHNTQFVSLKLAFQFSAAAFDPKFMHAMENVREIF